LSRLLGQQFLGRQQGWSIGRNWHRSADQIGPGWLHLATPSLSVVILPHLRKAAYDPLRILYRSLIVDGSLLFAVRPSARQTPSGISWRMARRTRADSTGARLVSAPMAV
jgi:hypothetical protein